MSKLPLSRTVWSIHRHCDGSNVPGSRGCTAWKVASDKKKRAHRCCDESSESASLRKSSTPIALQKSWLLKSARTFLSCSCAPSCTSSTSYIFFLSSPPEESRSIGNWICEPPSLSTWPELLSVT